MIKKLLVIVIIFFVVNQIDVYGQKNGAVLIFKDGRRLKGLGKVVSDGKMKFRKNKNEKPYMVDLKDVDKIKIYKKGGVYFRAYKKIKDKPTYKYLELVEEGKLTIYRKFKGIFLPIDDRNGLPFYEYKKNLNDYYVQREGEEEVTPLVLSDFFSVNFKNVALEYFKDCEKLITKIEREEFTKNDFSLIVDFYNYECE
ncbi:hypothetical protein [uncultured Aquimarina sp.]|uniref:hypothetical protein n=1 Tax=uncultured Aquimarina sp. TaxID=575652 RepID=UPI00260B2621|nr:hypothetical protein [uncultured Aquimarina sp.]